MWFPGSGPARGWPVRTRRWCTRPPRRGGRPSWAPGAKKYREPDPSANPV